MNLHISLIQSCGSQSGEPCSPNSQNTDPIIRINVSKVPVCKSTNALFVTFLPYFRLKFLFFSRHNAVLMLYFCGKIPSYSWGKCHVFLMNGDHLTFVKKSCFQSPQKRLEMSTCVLKNIQWCDSNCSTVHTAACQWP